MEGHADDGPVVRVHTLPMVSVPGNRNGWYCRVYHQICRPGATPPPIELRRLAMLMLMLDRQVEGHADQLK
jgi:hypothetical protein